MPRLSRSPLTVVATAAMAGAVLLGGGAAWAAWSVSGAGAGAAKADSLVTPVVTATRSTTAPTTAIDLSWAAAGQLPGATYSVTRNSTTISCTSNPCTDSGLAPGTTYNYAVTASLGQWTSAVGTASASTQAAAVNATSYAVSVLSPVTAGTSVQVTITAKRPDTTTDTGYTGVKSLTWSGTATAASPSGSTTSLPASVTFTNGVAVVSSMFVTAGAGMGLTATSASPGSLTGSTTVTVTAGTAARLGYTSTSTNKSPNVNCLLGCATQVNLGGAGSLTTKVSLLDQYGNATTFTSNVVVTLTSGGPTPKPNPTSLTVTAGQSESGLSTTLNESGSWTSDSLTASSSAPSLASVVINISK